MDPALQSFLKAGVKTLPHHLSYAALSSIYYYVMLCYTIRQSNMSLCSASTLVSFKTITLETLKPQTWPQEKSIWMYTCESIYKQLLLMMGFMKATHGVYNVGGTGRKFQGEL